MARWERKERIGEIVALVGQFVAVGRLAGTVFDGQDVSLLYEENILIDSILGQVKLGHREQFLLRPH